MAQASRATLTIPSGQTVSNIFNLQVLHSWNGMMYAPAVLPEVVKVQTSYDGVNFTTARSNGVDVTLAEARAEPLLGLTAHSIRLQSDTAVAASRTFQWQGVASAAA
jgi:hypothetical protein